MRITNSQSLLVGLLNGLDLYYLAQGQLYFFIKFWTFHFSLYNCSYNDCLFISDIKSVTQQLIHLIQQIHYRVRDYFSVIEVSYF